MKIKALVSFAGAFGMRKGEVRECSDRATLRDLLHAGYIEEVKEKPEKPKELGKAKKDVKSNEGK